MLHTQQNDTNTIYANTVKYILHLQHHHHYYNMLLLQHRLQIVANTASHTYINHINQGVKMKGRKTGRLEAPKTLISRSIRNRNINGLLWAFITLAHEEIKTAGHIETFSGSDIRDFVKLLHAREVESKLQDDATAAMSTRQLQQWIDASAASKEPKSK